MTFAHIILPFFGNIINYTSIILSFDYLFVNILLTQASVHLFYKPKKSAIPYIHAFILFCRRIQHNQYYVVDSMTIFVFDNFSLAQFALNVKRIAYINYLFVNITKIDRLEISQIVILTRDWLDFVHPFSNRLSDVCEIYRFFV